VAERTVLHDIPRKESTGKNFLDTLHTGTDLRTNTTSTSMNRRYQRIVSTLLG